MSPIHRNRERLTLTGLLKAGRGGKQNQRFVRTQITARFARWVGGDANTAAWVSGMPRAHKRS